ncbi:PTS sugar transporter subunit IIB [Xylocopilactobacillus apicola]|uniref:PTS sugar transporter subunit IIB n=1 Tax=Xylocopilactobacillus apicola TaxID=2932184 RepID=A0AAU9CUB8_9LACO|nr:PTS sugar transporter subunit IIB [Xylocopilactobacillus apicola]BDR57599.1 PTS sugar transporter subunit IIB [Xylocopilactobacillus apicola]
MTQNGTKKTILFVCATGIATSTVVAEKTLDYLKDQGIDVNYTQTNVASLPEYDLKNADLIVSTTNVPYELEIPVIRALPLITGVGADKVLEDIKNHLVD